MRVEDNLKTLTASGMLEGQMNMKQTSIAATGLEIITKRTGKPVSFEEINLGALGRTRGLIKMVPMFA